MARAVILDTLELVEWQMPETRKLFKGLFQTLDDSYVLFEMISERISELLRLNFDCSEETKVAFIAHGWLHNFDLQSR